ncbi:N-formylglutamate aminohydrolase [Gordonia neofelifaecis NRRL B-59395]|uniref:N-formylglutamate aminohydrolase n=1 Tax=Gordonia neofelifaecis NRRL B-59395 TaxID=644548 RepID=F1YE03_9ACTN|nr:N-formylglutamate aminohydrolase [Gordonia neofelifaecis NRRL B-59395]
MARSARTHSTIRPHLIVNELSPTTGDAGRPGGDGPEDVQPYAWLVADLVDERLAATGRAFIVDIHSPVSDQSPVGDPSAPCPEVLLNVDGRHLPPALLDAAVSAFGELTSPVTDAPHAGRYVPQLRHRGDQRVQAISLSIRESVLLDGHFAVNPESVERLGRAIGQVVGCVDAVGAPDPRRPPCRPVDQSGECPTPVL